MFPPDGAKRSFNAGLAPRLTAVQVLRSSHSRRWRPSPSPVPSCGPGDVPLVEGQQRPGALAHRVDSQPSKNLVRTRQQKENVGAIGGIDGGRDQEPASVCN